MKKIVTISGGTGGFTLLSGLKKYPINISAIVSMSDDGGSTGRLRDELGVLPAGDIRQCLVALSNASDELRALMNYRFTEGELKGHSFGNIFISVLEKTHKNFIEGIETAMDILKTKGCVIPVTTNNARLHVELCDGSIIEGEDKIDHFDLQKKGVKKIFFDPSVEANPKAIQSILEADVIVIGPGDLYGSILANLIINGIGSALKKTKAMIIFNINLTNKKGHTAGFDVDDYVSVIEDVIGEGRIDCVIFNDGKPSPNLMEKYRDQEGDNFLVEFNENKKLPRRYDISYGDLLKNDEIKEVKGDLIAKSRSFIRHDSKKLAKMIVDVIDRKIGLVKHK